MFKKFLPREEDFFELFRKMADILATTAGRFHTLLQDLGNQQLHVNAIATYEEEADAVAYTTFELLHKTFITPFDRHDIHQLINHLDDVLDLINRCAQRFPFYKLTQVPDELIQLAALGVRSTATLKDVLYLLHSLNNSGEILCFCTNLDHIESEGHRVVLAGEKKLFEDEQDFKTFFKLKEIYGSTKLVINRCQDVGNTIKGIVLEYS